MNMRLASLLIAAIGAVVLFQGCGESKKREKDPGFTLNGPPEQTGPQQSQADTKNGARIEVENPVFDFGVAGPNTRVKCQFKFKNAGTEELVIDKIISDCQCTTSDLEKKNYAPGESGVLEAFYRSSQDAGPTEKYIHILSNDKSNPNFELKLKGTIELKVAVEPSDKLNLLFSQPNGGLGPITLRSRDGKPFSITSFTSSQNVISAEFNPAEKKTEFILKPTVDVGKLRSNLSGSIQIVITHPQTTQLHLSFSALPMYIITPSRLTLQDAEPGKAVDRELWLKNNYDDTVDIESASSLNGSMELIRQDTTGNNTKLTVRITPPPQEANTKRYISDRLTLKMKDGEEVSVTCSGWYKLNVLR